MPHLVTRRLLARLSGGRLIQHVNFTLHGSLNGRRLRIPVLAGTGLMKRPFWEQEPWLDRALGALLQTADGAVVDVGVNLGQTLLKVKTLRPDARYVGFEPNPQCVVYVRRLIAENRFSDCTVAPFGLSDRGEARSLFAEDATDSSATVIEGFRGKQGTWARTPVAVLPGDEALESLRVGRVGLIKIDVEGAELEVVRGLRETLRRDQPHVVCEILPTHDESDRRWAFRKPRQDALLDLLRGAGYRMFRLLETGGAMRLEAIESHGDLALSNYAFVRSGADDAFLRAIGAASATSEVA
jgi:FkbM family methyltransferase